MTDNNGSAAAGNPGDGAGQQQPPQGDQGQPQQAWYSGVEDADLRGFAELKGWKDLGAALCSYRDLEKFQGVPPERLIKLPEADDKAAWGEVHKRLGFAPPEKAEEYGLDKLEGFDPGFAQYAQSTFHEIGLPKDMAVAAMTKIAERLGQMQADAESQRTTEHNNEVAKLKTEWGDKYDGLVELGKRAIAEYMPRSGLTDADMDAMRDAMGSAKFNKFWAGIGSTMGEAAFHEGGTTTTTGSLTPDGVNARIKALTQDREWFARKEAGGVKENDEWNRLVKLQAEYAANQHQRSW